MAYFYSAKNNAFYTDDLKSDYQASGNWPADAVEVPDGMFLEFSILPAPEGMMRIVGEDKLPAWGKIPSPTLEQIRRQKVALVQNHMDDAAKEYNYDSIATAVTYADEPAVEKFQNEGKAFRAWRSLVWQKCYEILADVESGKREIPSNEELISELPVLNFQ